MIRMIAGIGVFGVFSLGAGSFIIAAVLVFLLGVETRGEVLEKVRVDDSEPGWRVTSAGPPSIKRFRDPW